MGWLKSGMVYDPRLLFLFTRTTWADCIGVPLNFNFQDLPVPFAGWTRQREIWRFCFYVWSFCCANYINAVEKITAIYTAGGVCWVTSYFEFPVPSRSARSLNPTLRNLFLLSLIPWLLYERYQKKNAEKMLD
jgi:hypothetical protein